MKLVEDLGLFEYGTEGRKCRHGIFRCEECKKTQRLLFDTVHRSKSGVCKECTLTNFKHGLVSHRLYEVWVGMNQRCYNPKREMYIHYGGRGITVCKEWRDDFLPFFQWSLKNGYRDSLSIDRINNDGNYSPLNCRFASASTQARNTQKIRSTNTTGFRGASVLRGKFQASIGINNKKIYLGVFDYPWTAGLAYDSYVIKNNLEHTRNYKDIK